MNLASNLLPRDSDKLLQPLDLLGRPNVLRLNLLNIEVDNRIGDTIELIELLRLRDPCLDALYLLPQLVYMLTKGIRVENFYAEEMDQFSYVREERGI